VLNNQEESLPGVEISQKKSTSDGAQRKSIFIRNKVSKKKTIVILAEVKTIKPTSSKSILL
jgi:hypothetical protein